MSPEQMKAFDRQLVKAGTVIFTPKELRILRQAMRIATEDGSLSGFAASRDIDRLAAKIERAMA